MRKLLFQYPQVPEDFTERFKAHCEFVFSKDIFSYNRIGSIDHYLNGCADVVDDFDGQFNLIQDPLQELITELLDTHPDLRSEKVAIYINFEKAEIWVG